MTRTTRLVSTQQCLRVVQLQVLQVTVKYAIPEEVALHDGPVHDEPVGHVQSPATNGGEYHVNTCYAKRKA